MKHTRGLKYFQFLFWVRTTPQATSTMFSLTSVWRWAEIPTPTHNYQKTTILILHTPNFLLLISVPFRFKAVRKPTDTADERIHKAGSSMRSTAEVEAQLLGQQCRPCCSSSPTNVCCCRVHPPPSPSCPISRRNCTFPTHSCIATVFHFLIAQDIWSN